jgi:hypothetical protein
MENRELNLTPATSDEDAGERTRGNGSAGSRLRSERKGARKITAKGRLRMAEVGAQNLANYRARIAGKSVSRLPTEMQEKLDRFESELLSDLGELTAAERCLLDSAKVSYQVILIASNQLALAPGRLKQSKGLSGAIAAHQNSLHRTLKSLGLKRRAAKTESLDDYLRSRGRPE